MMFSVWFHPVRNTVLGTQRVFLGLLCKMTKNLENVDNPKSAL